MPVFAALLRAVNVSGKNRVPMAELRRGLVTTGLRDVRTYVQSGNVVFRADGVDPSTHATTIRGWLRAGLDVDAAVLVLTAAEMGAVVGGSPFPPLSAPDPAAPAPDERHLHVTFLLPSEPDGRRVLAAAQGSVVPAAASSSLLADDPELRERFAALVLPAAVGEAAVLRGRVVYLHLPHGYGRSRLTATYLERALGHLCTTRNWRTVVALADMILEYREA